MQRTLGGDRLGSGKKMTVNLHNYGRSSHNLSRAWRSSMAPGTLVPFFVEPALNGDTFDIDIQGLVRTLPTIAPMFGSFKLQADFFVAPMRLYNRQLHNNKLGIGMEMHKVIFPKLKIEAYDPRFNIDNPNGQQVNQSSLLAYLGIKGIGKNNGTQLQWLSRSFDAQPFLAYWEIFKNYYANKQESNAWVIDAEYNHGNHTFTYAANFVEGGLTNFPKEDRWIFLAYSSGANFVNKNFILKHLYQRPHDKIFTNVQFKLKPTDAAAPPNYMEQIYSLQEVIDNNWANVTFPDNYSVNIEFIDPNSPFTKPNYAVYARGSTLDLQNFMKPMLTSFPLKNIDDMRETILTQSNNIPLELNGNSPIPYSTPLMRMNFGLDGFRNSFTISEMCGLALKTYQSDRFNNWLSTDWIDGTNGISEITKVDTSDGLKLDALNLAQKVYNMLTMIAVSGGSYNDWQEAVYGEITRPAAETPWFAGGTSQEITFTEVTSTAEVDEYNPLGTLAGKGYSHNNSKHIHIRIQEPSFIIGIISITPRLDYSQGNKWYTNLNTMDDLHKPALDAIGFQELITDEFTSWDTNIDTTNVNNMTPIFKSAGKQPSWIHYMTAVNECHANFAKPNMEMYMTLNRDYQMNESGNIKDLTTYIDPEKSNINFARSDIGAQNFWVQLGIECVARRKMSAKQIPHF